MRDVDPDASNFDMERFFKLIYEITEFLGMPVENLQSSFVESLTKTEEQLHFLCEARNHLNWRDKKTKMAERTHELTLERFEKHQEKEKQEKKLIMFKEQQKQKEIEMNKKLVDKARNSKAAAKSTGKRDMYRSTKKKFKAEEKKKDNMDEQTRDEKDYLGNELFDILQGIKGAIAKGEIEDEGLDDVPEVQSMPTSMQSSKRDA